MTRGMLWAKTTLPAGGAAFTMAVTGLPGTSVRTIPAGTYRLDELLAAFKLQLELGMVALGGADGFILTTHWGETPGALTGRFTMECDGSAYAITAWGSTVLRDFLGFTGTLAAASSHTSVNNLTGLWLPDCPHDAPRGRNSGHKQKDRTLSIAPGGDRYALNYNTDRQRLGRVTWSHVSHALTLTEAELVVNASFETWWNTTHGGEHTWFPASPDVRLIWDADDTSEYVDIFLTEPLDGFNPQRADAQWVGLWPVTIDGYVVT